MMSDTLATARPSLTVIVPALNAAGTLARALAALEEGRRSFAVSVLVVDGGSNDRTLELARRLGADVLEAAPGRGMQLRAGAAASHSEWLLFLHADTVLAPDWSIEAAKFIENSDNERRAAAFRFALDDKSSTARRVEGFVAWRCRVFGLAYGDQGLLISRRFYGEIGGFRRLPLMEDVDMVRRIGRRRLVMLAAAATTSAERYRSEGYVSRGMRNLLCLGLYFAGVPAEFIAKIYG